MNQSATRIVLGAVVLATAIAATFWMRQGEAPKPPALAPAPTTASVPSPAAPPPAISVAAAPAPPTATTRDRSISFGGPVGSSVLPLRYETESDRRAMFDQLQASADPQAPFFAAKILRECMDMTNKGLDAMQKEFEAKAAVIPALRTKQTEAFQKLKSPCAKFFGRPTTLEEIEELEAEGVRRGDPRAIARALALGKIDPKSNTHEVAEQAVSQGDPYVIADLATWLSQQTGRVTIMGAPVASADVVAANIAWQLVACDHGLPCGADSSHVLSLCAFDGVCGKTSYEDMVRTTILNPQQYQRAQELRARIEAALQSKDYGSLGI